MDRLESLIGEVIDGKYLIEHRLGQGGMGAVYLATHLGTKRPVAIKFIVPDLMTDATFVKRFMREAEAAGRLRHPNVINVTDFGFAEAGFGRTAYLVMEHLGGGSLGKMIAEHGPLPLDFVVEVIEQTCLAVCNAHAQGVIHRDLKPDNIWLEPNGRGGFNVKVMDFGIAKLHDAGDEFETSGDAFAALPSASVSLSPVAMTFPSSVDSEGATLIKRGPEKSEEATAKMSLVRATAQQDLSTVNGDDNLTQFGDVIGTPLYMSPEQCCGSYLGPRSDIYSLGVIAYTALTGGTPFTGNAAELIAKHKNEPPPSLRAKRKDLSKDVEDVIFSALEKDPARRPVSAVAFATALRATAEGANTVINQAKSMYYTATQLFYLLGLFTGLPFAAATLAVVMGGLTVAQRFGWSLLMVLPFAMIFCYAAIVFANRFNAAACALAVEKRLAAPNRPVEIKPILRHVLRRSPEIAATVARSLWMSLTATARRGVEGMKTGLDHTLAIPIVVLENRPAHEAMHRSTTLMPHLRAVALAVLARDLGAAGLAILTGFPAMSGFFLSGGATLPSSPLALRITLLVTAVSVLLSWVQASLILPVYSGIPRALLYFRARQAYGESLEEVATLDIQPVSIAKPPRRVSVGTIAWGVTPVLVLALAGLFGWIGLQQKSATLLQAVREGRANEVRRLLAAGADPNSGGYGNGETVLMRAAREGFADVTKALLDAGADPARRDGDGDTALIYAARSGRPEIVTQLLGAHADPNACDKQGRSALRHAAGRGRLDVTRLLLAAGASPNARDAAGMSPLQAAFDGGHLEVAATLKLSGAKE